MQFCVSKSTDIIAGVLLDSKQQQEKKGLTDNGQALLQSQSFGFASVICFNFHSFQSTHHFRLK